MDFEAKTTPSSFGFDKKVHFKWSNNYEIIKLANYKNYFVPYQSLGALKDATSTQTGQVIANFKFIGNYTASNVTFKLGNTTITPTNTTLIAGGAIFSLTLPSKDMKKEAIYAFYGTKKIGKLNIIPLKRREEKVILVPVNGAIAPSVTTLQTYLDGVYGQVNVKFTVTTKTGFSFNLDSMGVAGLERAGDGLNKYSSEMRILRDKFAKNNPTYDKDASYIFVVPAFEPDPTGGNIEGFMPRGRSMGFVLAGTGMRTYAHELGHGVFGLEHTFPDILKGSTNNLMDYSSGTNLTQKQWDAIEKNKFVWSWRDDEEDAASVSLAVDRKVISKILNEIRTNIDNGVMGYYPFATIDHHYYPTSQGDKLFKVYGGLNIDYATELAGYISIERLNSNNNGQIMLNNYTSEVGTIYHTITWAGEMEISVSSLVTYNTILAYLTKLPKTGVKAGKMIFVNGHYNEVASAFGMSPSTGFKDYWASLYESEAKKYFNETSDFGLYVDGASALGGSENGIQRKERGKEWAKNNSNLLYSNMSATGTFKIMGHSEGAAFGSGIAEYLFSQGKTVQKVVYLSADEADEFSHNQAIDAVQIAYASCKKSILLPMHYPYDGVVGNHKIYGVEKYGVVDRNDLERVYIHGMPAFDIEIFKELKDLDMYQGIETLQYNWNSARGEKEYIRPTFPNGTLFYNLDKFTFHLHTCP